MTYFSAPRSRRSLLTMAATLLGISAALGANQQGHQTGDSARVKFLVHIHTGPENPTKAALGFLVAVTALKQGYHVDLFLAGDGAFLIGDAALSNVEGKGTGNLGAHFKELAGGGARFYVSGMSARARGISETDLNGKPAEFAAPDVLVRLAASADVVLAY